MSEEIKIYLIKQEYFDEILNPENLASLRNKTNIMLNKTDENNETSRPYIGPIEITDIYGKEWKYYIPLSSKWKIGNTNIPKTKGMGLRIIGDSYEEKSLIRTANSLINVPDEYLDECEKVKGKYEEKFAYQQKWISNNDNIEQLKSDINAIEYAKPWINISNLKDRGDKISCRDCHNFEELKKISGANDVNYTSENSFSVLDSTDNIENNRAQGIVTYVESFPALEITTESNETNNMQNINRSNKSSNKSSKKGSKKSSKKKVEKINNERSTNIEDDNSNGNIREETNRNTIDGFVNSNYFEDVLREYSNENNFSNITYEQALAKLKDMLNKMKDADDLFDRMLTDEDSKELLKQKDLTNFAICICNSLKIMIQYTKLELAVQVVGEGEDTHISKKLQNALNNIKRDFSQASYIYSNIYNVEEPAGVYFPLENKNPMVINALNSLIENCRKYIEEAKSKGLSSMDAESIFVSAFIDIAKWRTKLITVEASAKSFPRNKLNTIMEFANACEVLKEMADKVLWANKNRNELLADVKNREVTDRKKYDFECKMYEAYYDNFRKLCFEKLRSGCTEAIIGETFHYNIVQEELKSAFKKYKNNIMTRKVAIYECLGDKLGLSFGFQNGENGAYHKEGNGLYSPKKSAKKTKILTIKTIKP